MRIFAGPNGSGKSTIIYDIKKNYYSGFYLNADEIQKACSEKGFINLGDYQLKISTAVFEQYLSESSLREKSEKDGYHVDLKLQNNVITTGKNTHAYEAALIAEFLRQQLISVGHSFSFETVMSHASKLEILKQALDAGYRNYLYFISTDSVQINIARVKERVRKGGHNVDEEKIVERYTRSLDLLSKVIPYTYRTFLIDNSRLSYRLIAEFEKDNFVIHDQDIPNWFRLYVLEKMQLLK